jgi:hypothetical protein
MSQVLSGSAFALACIAFTLPFGSVASCSGAEVEFTGVELATFSVDADGFAEQGLRDGVERNAGLLALATLAFAAAGVALTLFARRGAGICAAAGLAAAQLLLYAMAVSSDGGGGDVDVGYWLVLLGFFAAATACLAGEIRTRKRRCRSILPPIGLALAVTVPPLGTAVAIIAAVLVWIGRRVARSQRARPATF